MYFKRISIISFLCFLVAASCQVSGQNTQVLPDSQIVFTDLNRALINPEKVYKLKLKKKRLTEVPAAVFTMFPNLRYLDLSHNALKEIPESLSSVSLEFLNVSHNKLTGLPAAIGTQDSLRRLILNNNDIVSLPAEIGNCKSLVYIDLWNNEMESIPDEIKQIAGNLKVMDLRAILFDIDQQARIRELLPKTKIYFSPGCNCGK